MSNKLTSVSTQASVPTARAPGRHRENMAALYQKALVQRPGFMQHGQRCAVLAYSVSLLLGLTPQQCRVIAEAARVHDIGELLLDPQVTGKAGEPADPDGMIYQQHTLHGARLLREYGKVLNGGYALHADVALSHHERWNGSGFPNGITGARIPLGARVVAVVDAFHEKVAASSDPESIAVARALTYVQEMAGILFDPLCSEMLVGAVGRDLERSLQQYGQIFHGESSSDQLATNLFLTAMQRNTGSGMAAA